MGSDKGYSLRSDRTSLPLGEETRWVFEVVGPSGRPATYRVQHQRELHLIVVRDDLSTFTHLHPTRTPDGMWTIGLTFSKPGSYTAFADVAPDDEEPMTLRLPLTVEGHAVRGETPEPSRRASTGPYEVDLTGDVAAGAMSHIEFRVTKDGTVVEPEPYLGAAGHLVAIRTGDLEYLHVHPMDSREIGVIPFMMHAEGGGRYRLFLQFQHEGDVRTVDFTVDATEPDRVVDHHGPHH